MSKPNQKGDSQKKEETRHKQETSPNIKTCFVIMPFTRREVDSETYPDPQHWMEVYEGIIAPACRATSLVPMRDDTDFTSRNIIQTIMFKIEHAEIVVCDLSSHNPNVLFELGWTIRANKPYILMKDKVTKFMFDLSQNHTIEYDQRLQPSEVKEKIEKLSSSIRSTLNDPARPYSLVDAMHRNAEIKSLAEGGDSNSAELISIKERLSRLELGQSGMLDVRPTEKPSTWGTAPSSKYEIGRGPKLFRPYTEDTRLQEADLTLLIYELCNADLIRALSQEFGFKLEPEVDPFRIAKLIASQAIRLFKDTAKSQILFLIEKNGGHLQTGSEPSN